jgi:hypothetical protein
LIGSGAVNVTAGDSSLQGFKQAADGSVFVGRASKVDSTTTYFVEKLDERLRPVFSKQIYAAINDVAADASGSVYLAGSVQAADVQGAQLAQFPILNSFRAGTADTDLFVMKIAPDGSLVYSTLLSATCTFECPSPDGSLDIGYVITTDSQNRAYVAGVSTGLNFPTTDRTAGTLPSRVSDFDPVVFVLDSNVPHSTPLHTRLEEWNPAITYTGTWSADTRPEAKHSGSTARFAADMGSTFAMSFTGAGELGWFGCRDESSGIARVFLDGVLQATIDTYAAPGSCGQLIWSMSGIGLGNHTLGVEVTGTRNAASQASRVWVDKIEITSVGDIILGTAITARAPSASATPTRIENTSAQIRYTGQWFMDKQSAHSGGSAAIATTPGSKATITFTGTGVQWIGNASDCTGFANIFVDGVFKGEVNTFAASALTKTVLYSASGLNSGTHTLTIELSPRKNPTTTQSFIWIDAFDVSN